MGIAKQVSGFIAEARRRNELLFYLGMSLFAMFILFLATFGVCQKPVFEICSWLKPFKFTVSFAVYVFTLGWFIEYLKPIFKEKTIRQLSRCIATLVIIEMIVILFQSWQTTDRYAALQLSMETNQKISSVLFTLGNVTILVNTAVAMYIGIQFFRKIHLEPVAYLWGIRASFLVFILSCFVGGFVLHHYGQVPLDPYHLGLPFSRFDSVRGNLLSMHFVGIHFLQLLPMCCYFLPEGLAKWCSISAVSLYIGGCLFFMIQVV